MPSAILGTRKGSNPVTDKYSKAQVLMLETTILKSADFLTNKKSESDIAKSLGGTDQMVGSLAVFGIAVHVWPETSVSQDLARGAKTAVDNIKGVFAKMEKDGYKSVLLTVTYKEAYNCLVI
ncbi:hypothetical protein [Lysinibacillus sp. G4S2]|uniref:hypothetical protein n=1 Tax=Lysinibacillus sp. G4S2 TaxID=3055859 RepID=UPI0025A1DA33|nr:hypothetical protein [Lysinibacillus sp. G4S2]MDM5246027.1 hypothetical protein [Lysinibacillus sp. G4S2]